MAVDASAPAPSQTMAAPTEEWPPYADPSYKMPASIEVTVQKRNLRQNLPPKFPEASGAEHEPRHDTRAPAVQENRGSRGGTAHRGCAAHRGLRRALRGRWAIELVCICSRIT